MNCPKLKNIHKLKTKIWKVEAESNAAQEMKPQCFRTLNNLYDKNRVGQTSIPSSKWIANQSGFQYRS